MAVVAPIIVAATTTDLAVVFFVTAGVAAALTAVIAAVADPVISDKFMAKIALCLRLPCIGMRGKHSYKHDTAQQHAQQLMQPYSCFHKQFLLS